MRSPLSIPSDSNLFRISKFGIRILVFAWACALPSPLWACAACYGASDSPMAKGMNWGIASMLVMVVLVLGGVAGFFVYLARRSAALTPAPARSRVNPPAPTPLRAPQPQPS
jgi:hypothetical protein